LHRNDSQSVGKATYCSFVLSAIGLPADPLPDTLLTTPEAVTDSLAEGTAPREADFFFSREV
jgi:hypothetical protein